MVLLPTPRALAVAALQSQIRAYARLPRNWDTYGGLPAGERPIVFAVALLGALFTAAPEFPLPFVAPISTGVSLSWGRVYIEADDQVADCSYGDKSYADPEFRVGLAAQLITAYRDRPAPE